MGRRNRAIELAREELKVKGDLPSDPEEMQRFVGDGPILTDDRPLLEYHRSIRDSGPPVDLSSLRGDINRYLRP